MATTFYFNDDLGGTGITPSVDADWNGGQTVSNFERHKLSTVRDGSSYFNLDTTEGGSLQNCCQVQYISEPLAAQTISGTINIGIMQSVNVTGAVHFAYHLRVCTSSGTTRGQLVDGTENVNTINSLTYSQQYEAAVAISSVVVSEGDYLVVELGYEINNTSSKDMGTKIGSSSSNLSDTDGSTTLATGFVTFSDDITFFVPNTTRQLMMTGCGT